MNKPDRLFCEHSPEIAPRRVIRQSNVGGTCQNIRTIRNIDPHRRTNKVLEFNKQQAIK